MLPKAARDLTADMMLNVPGITDKLSGGGAGGGGSDSSANSSISSTTGGRAETETAAKPYANLFAAATGGGKEGGQEARGSGVSGHTSEAADKQYTGGLAQRTRDCAMLPVWDYRRCLLIKSSWLTTRLHTPSPP
jgi:hypothetical protein